MSEHNHLHVFNEDDDLIDRAVKQYYSERLNGGQSRATEHTPSTHTAEQTTFNEAIEHERAGRYKEAIHLFLKVRAKRQALRVIKSKHISTTSEELLDLSTTDSWSQQTAARLLIEMGDIESAIQCLKGSGKAVDLAIKHNLLHLIDFNPTDKQDTSAGIKLAEYHYQNQQYDQAIESLIRVHEYEKALAICETHNIIINDQLAERLTPSDRQSQKEVLVALAGVLRSQGSYQLACKKFTEAGDKVKGMKALMKTNDNEKILQFANAAREPEIYILAANFFVTLDWQHNDQLKSMIESLLIKAKDEDRLTRFRQLQKQS